MFDSKQYQKQYRKERYFRLKELGICTRCGKEQARPGKTVCLSCSFRYHKLLTPEQTAQVNEQRKQTRQNRLENGLCPDCGKPLYPRHQRCYEHMMKKRQYYHLKEKDKRSRKYRETGVCIRCGGERVEGKTVCGECLEKLRQSAVRNFGPYWKGNSERAIKSGWAPSCGF